MIDLQSGGKGRRMGLGSMWYSFQQINHFSCINFSIKCFQKKSLILLRFPLHIHTSEKDVSKLKYSKDEIQYLPLQEGTYQIRETELPKTIKSV